MNYELRMAIIRTHPLGDIDLALYLAVPDWWGWMLLVQLGPRQTRSRDNPLCPQCRTPLQAWSDYTFCPYCGYQ